MLFGSQAYGSLAGVRLVTLAPELQGGLEAVRQLAARGVLVSLGHSTAGLDVGLQAARAGARLITHLFNAMPAFHHRDPGLIGLLGVDVADLPPSTACEAGTDRRQGSSAPRPCYSIICDGLHCHPASVRIAFGAHPAGAVLITDAMPAMGLGDGLHSLGDMAVLVQGISATIAEAPAPKSSLPAAAPAVNPKGTLAGAVVPMDQCVRNFHQFSGCSVPEALEAASTRPARLLFGDDTLVGTLRPGAPADLVVLSPDLHLRAVYRGGCLVHEADSA